MKIALKDVQDMQKDVGNFKEKIETTLKDETDQMKVRINSINLQTK